MHTPLAAVFIVLFLFSEAQPPTGLMDLRKHYLEEPSFDRKDSLNLLFLNQLRDAILAPNGFKLRLDSLPKVGTVLSDDKKLRLITWNTVDEWGQFTHFGFLQTSSGDVLDLSDASKGMPTPDLQSLSPHKWFGALYYQIVKIKNKGGNYYVLLGFDGNDNYSSRKVIEFLHFDIKLKKWIFGRRQFAPPFSDKTRYILEYSNQVSVSLRYHANRKQIVFDHLTPMNPGVEGIYSFYVPDMSFDAFELKKGIWHLVQNVDIRGPKPSSKFFDPALANPPVK